MSRAPVRGAGITVHCRSRRRILVFNPPPPRARRKRDRTSATCDRPARAPRYRRAARRRGRGTRAAHAHFRVAWPQGRSAQARRRVARRVRARGPTPRPRARSTCPAASACSRAAPARAALLPRVRTEARWSRVRRVHDIVNVWVRHSVRAPPAPPSAIYTVYGFTSTLHRLACIRFTRLSRASLSRAAPGVCSQVSHMCLKTRRGHLEQQAAVIQILSVCSRSRVSWISCASS